MLYINTRDKIDSYTAARTLLQDSADNGGAFLPIRLPAYDSQQLEAIMQLSFNDAIAHILNVFFSKNLTGWDVEFAIGRKPLNVVKLNGKIVVAELWGSTAGNYKRAACRLYARLCEGQDASDKPTGWAAIAIRVAYLFGLFGELGRLDIHGADLAVTASDADAVLAAWYARKMGLPIGTIICASTENGWIWGLLHKGEVSLASNFSADISAGIERLLYSCFGGDQVNNYLRAVESRSIYKVESHMRDNLNEGLFTAVIGNKRAEGLIGSVLTTTGYQIDSNSAASYGALQDYRAQTGENNITLLLTEDAPNR